MLENLLGALSIPSLIAYCIIGLVARLLYNKYATGLNHIPGPFLAGFTDCYRLAVARGYRPERWHIDLSKQYGDFVRIGPRTVLCSSNKAAKQIYALNSGFKKVREQSLSFQSINIYVVELLHRATDLGEGCSTQNFVHFNR